MPTITQDPLRPEALEGLKEPRGLLTTLNRLQAEAGAILNSGATLANAWRAVLTGVEVVTPSEWTGLTATNGFVDGATGQIGPFAARKCPLTKRVEVREVVKRAAGAPGGVTVVADLPAGYGPATYLIRTAECDGGHGVYDVVPASGSTPAQLRWVSGTPTTRFYLNGGSWQAEDPGIPPWEKPVTVRLVDRRAPSVVRLVLCLARTADGATGIASTVTFPGAYIQPPQEPGDPRLLVLPRIDGLKPERRYSLTLWAFFE